MRTLILFALAAAAAFADVEERSTDTRTFAHANLLIVDNVNGSIDVTGYEGSEVRLELERHITAETAERLDAAKREVKVDMLQSGETVKLYVDGPFRCHCSEGYNNSRGHQGYSVTYDFKLRVPAAARVDLYTVNHGTIAVRGIGGDFDIHNVNGRVDLTGMGGSGKAHTVNGPVTAAFSRNPVRASSFETVNGKVDLTFRKGLNADVRMHTMHGELLTDFEVARLAEPPPPAETQSGRHVFKRNANTGVRIGSGGFDINLKTINGDIFIRNSDK